MASEVERLREENAKLKKEVESLRLELHKEPAVGACEMNLKALGLSCVKEHQMSNSQVQRYCRQLILDKFGVEAQERLCSSSVLIVGAGGLGSSAAMYLAGAGVGKLGIVDKDTVSLDNLHRQIIHREDHVGWEKTLSAKDACQRLNSLIEVHVHNGGFLPEGALEIVDQYDVVIDATDNVTTRYLISDACVISGKPLVSGAAIGTDGQLTVYNLGDRGPCFRCVFPEAPSQAACNTCSDTGVLGPVPGVVGVLQALEAIKIVTKVGTVLSKRLLFMDFMDSQFRQLKLRGKVDTCAACGVDPEITRSSLHVYNYSLFTGQGFDEDSSICASPVPLNKRITADGAFCLLTRTESRPMLLDVRPSQEFRLVHIQGAVNIPLSDWNSCFSDVLRKCNLSNPPDSSGAVKSDAPEPAAEPQVLVICRRGNDSQVAVQRLWKAGISRAMDIIGGLESWGSKIDPEMPVY